MLNTVRLDFALSVCRLERAGISLQPALFTCGEWRIIKMRRGLDAFPPIAVHPTQYFGTLESISSTTR